MKRIIAIAGLAALISSGLTASAQTPAQPQPQAQPQAQPQPDAQRRQRHRSFEDRFKRLDKNSDGSISRDEWPRGAAAFDRLDANHDGMLSQDELRQARNRKHRR